MIVYGDHGETVDPAKRLAELEERRAEIAGMAAGLERHAAMAGLLIELGRLCQGVADAAFHEQGCDVRDEAERACLVLLQSVAHALIGSWRSAFECLEALPPLQVTVPLPDTVLLKQPEGHAFYTLYPEAYAEAALQLRLPPPMRVIGLRSIGTGLAAVVAAALDTGLPYTVRPTGHPFARELRLHPEVSAELLDPAFSYVIVDEGPGLSGSSFGAVADALEAAGIAPERIAFLPGHGGELGPQASEPHRRRWAQAQRPVVSGDALLGPRLPSWLEQQLGTLDSATEDISGGAWRERFWEEGDYPAVDSSQERRKWLVRAGGETWLVKFAGLGQAGEAKLARARLLAAAGFIAEPAACLYGFLVQRWIEATPIRRFEPQLARFATRYFGARARLFPAAPERGAGMDALYEMARFNTETLLGEDATRRLEPWAARLSDLAERSRPVEVDGKCEPHEWLRDATGRFFKADALDHHAAHDLIGCQDIAWDVAGFAVEFSLDGEQTAAFVDAVGQASGHAIDAELLAFLTRCYLAFRLGQRHLTAAGLTGWPAERDRNLRARDAYAARLEQLLRGWTVAGAAA